MKTTRILTPLLAIAAFAATLVAKPLAGPKGGRILTTSAPHAEFFVEKDRKAVVTFYDAALKPIAPADQVVSAVAEAKAGKVNLEFEKTPQGFVSKQPLPEGDGYRVVVQIREKAGVRPANYRLDFHDETCAECKRAEYACTCDEAGSHGHDHEKKK